MNVKVLLMPYQNADSGDSFLVVFAFGALVIFILMLLAAFMTARSERKTKNEPGPEKDHKSRVTAGGSARLFALDISNGERKTRQPAFLESFKTLNWWACCIISSFVAFFGYFHVQRTLLPTFQVPGYYYLSAYILAILSPTCLAVAWLRLTGVQWRRALVLFLFVPMGAFIIWYAVNILPHWFAT